MQVLHEASDTLILKAEGWLRLHDATEDRKVAPNLLLVLKAVACLDAAEKAWMLDHGDKPMREEWQALRRRSMNLLSNASKSLAAGQAGDPHRWIVSSDAAKRLAEEEFVDGWLHVAVALRTAAREKLDVQELADELAKIGVIRSAGTIRNKLSTMGIAPRRGVANRRRIKRPGADQSKAVGLDLQSGWNRKR